VSPTLLQSHPILTQERADEIAKKIDAYYAAKQSRKTTTLGGIPFAGITPEKASEKVVPSKMSKTLAASKERVAESRVGYIKENPSVNSNRGSPKRGRSKTRKTLSQAGTWQKKTRGSIEVPVNSNPCKDCGTPLNSGHPVCSGCAKIRRANGKGSTRQGKSNDLISASVAKGIAENAGNSDGLKETISMLREEIVAMNEERDLEEEYKRTEQKYADKKREEFMREEKRRELESWYCSFYEDKPHSKGFLLIATALMTLFCVLLQINLDYFWPCVTEQGGAQHDTVFHWTMMFGLIQFWVQGLIVLVLIDSVISVLNGRVTVWNGHLTHDYKFVRHITPKDKEYSDCRALAIASGEMLFNDPRGFVFSYSRKLFGFQIGAATPFGPKVVYGVASYELLCQLCVHKNIDSDLDDLVALDKMKWMSKTMHAVNQNKDSATRPQGAIPEKTCRIAYGILRQARNECADFPAPSMH